MQFNVLEYLEKSALIVPDKPAFVDEKKSITYKQLQQQAKSIGFSLIQHLNSTIRKPVVVFVDRNIESLVSFFGVAYSGNFYVPLDISMPKMRIELILQTLNPIATVVLQKDLEFSKSLASNLTTLVFEEIIKKPFDDAVLSKIRRQIIDKDPLYATFTSGSTGVPKGVITCHQSVIEMTDNLVETFELNDQHVFGNQNPFYFDASIKDIYCTLKTGGTMYIIPKSVFLFPAQIVQYLNQNNISVILWSAAAIALIANADAFCEESPMKLKKVMFSGEVMHNKVLNYWRKRLPETQFVNLYGPTEITSVCTYYIIEKKFADNEVLPIGIPFKNAEILLLKEDNTLVCGDEIGEICVRGACLALGYYNNFEKTNEVFCQNPTNLHYPELIYRTGDLAKYNEHGEIMFLSRKDNQVKHMGQRVELGEIEILVNAMEKIEASFCFYDHEKQKIVLVYEGEEADNKYIINELKNSVSKFMFPNIMIKIEKMPYNLNGKIDRVLLKAEYKNGNIG
jgi:amino acid adenylation domain-containing protein